MSLIYDAEAHDWRDYAACRGLDPDLFFGLGRVPQEAYDTCQGCPVKANCLEDALSYPFDLDWGVWGGTTRNQREGIRAEREHRGPSARASRHPAALVLVPPPSYQQGAPA